jgi:ribonuclease BN (tRNA processing enzyme)
MINRAPRIDALFIEASFPNSMRQLAEASKHLTPEMLSSELRKLSHNGMDILAVHLKPAYREKVATEIAALGINNLTVMETGRVYKW